jgi:hypothetical protein
MNSNHMLLAMITDGMISLPYRTLHLSFHMWKVAMSFSILVATAMVALSSLKNALLNVDLMTYLESIVHAQWCSTAQCILVLIWKVSPN